MSKFVSHSNRRWKTLPQTWLHIDKVMGLQRLQPFPIGNGYCNPITLMVFYTKKTNKPCIPFRSASHVPLAPSSHESHVVSQTPQGWNSGGVDGGV